MPEARLFVAPARKVCPGGVERLDLKGKAEAMEARIHVITLAVADLERALAFYRDGLGLHTPGVVGSEHVGDDTTAAGAVAMFELDDGLIGKNTAHIEARAVRRKQTTGNVPGEIR